MLIVDGNSSWRIVHNLVLIQWNFGREFANLIINTERFLYWVGIILRYLTWRIGLPCEIALLLNIYK